MTRLEQLAQRIMEERYESELMAKEASDLRDRLDFLEKRARAEQILLDARDGNAPPGLRASTIEDFLSKRAELESASDDHLEKVATLVQYMDDMGGLLLSDEPDELVSGDFNGWLASIA